MEHQANARYSAEPPRAHLAACGAGRTAWDNAAGCPFALKPPAGARAAAVGTRRDLPRGPNGASRYATSLVQRHRALPNNRPPAAGSRAVPGSTSFIPELSQRTAEKSSALVSLLLPCTSRSPGRGGTLRGGAGGASRDFPTLLWVWGGYSVGTRSVPRGTLLRPPLTAKTASR